MRAYHTEHYYAEVVVSKKFKFKEFFKSRTKHFTFCVKVDINNLCNDFIQESQHFFIFNILLFIFQICIPKQDIVIII